MKCFVRGWLGRTRKLSYAWSRLKPGFNIPCSFSSEFFRVRPWMPLSDFAMFHAVFQRVSFRKSQPGAHFPWARVSENTRRCCCRGCGTQRPRRRSGLPETPRPCPSLSNWLRAHRTPRINHTSAHSDLLEHKRSPQCRAATNLL